MRKLGFVLFTLSMLSAFTLGFMPAVAWANPVPKSAPGSDATVSSQLTFQWAPAVPRGLTMRMARELAPYLAQAQAPGEDSPEGSKTTAPAEPEAHHAGRTRARTEARPGEALYKAGMWMFIGGGAGLVLGVTGVVSAFVVCAEFTSTITCAGGVVVGILGVIFAVIGGLVMVAGIPIWIVGAAKRKQPLRTFKQDPYDPFQQRVDAQRDRSLPVTQKIAGYTFKF